MSRQQAVGTQQRKVKLTPSLERLEDELSDGLHHTALQLRKALGLGDDPTDLSNLRVHVSNLRKELKKESKMVLCTRVYNGKTYDAIYQLIHVQLS